MPIECELLKGAPSVLQACPSCGASPFDPFMRGMVQRSARRFWFFGKRRPYCAVICWGCKEIVGWE